MPKLSKCRHCNRGYYNEVAKLQCINQLEGCQTYLKQEDVKTRNAKEDIESLVNATTPKKDVLEGMSIMF